MRYRVFGTHNIMPFYYTSYVRLSRIANTTSKQVNRQSSFVVSLRCLEYANETPSVTSMSFMWFYKRHSKCLLYE